MDSNRNARYSAIRLVRWFLVHGNILLGRTTQNLLKTTWGDTRKATTQRVTIRWFEHTKRGLLSILTSKSMVSRNFNVRKELFFLASENMNVGQSWNTLKSLHPTCSGEISHSDQNQIITHRGVNKPSRLPIRLWPSILYISVDFLPSSFYEDSFLLGRTCRYNHLLLRNTPLGES